MDVIAVLPQNQSRLKALFGPFQTGLASQKQVCNLAWDTVQMIFNLHKTCTIDVNEKLYKNVLTIVSEIQSRIYMQTQRYMYLLNTNT